MNMSILHTWPCRYGGEHAAVDLQKEAVYGLTELFREQVRVQQLLASHD